jgi:anthranilate synthase component I
MKFKFKTNIVKSLSDTHTPVVLYLKLRDKFPHSFLLESSEYKSKENSFSYICLKPTASFIVERDKTSISYPMAKKKSIKQPKSMWQRNYTISQIVFKPMKLIWGL